jgi:hypothetical protein
MTIPSGGVTNSLSAMAYSFLSVAYPSGAVAYLLHAMTFPLPVMAFPSRSVNILFESVQNHILRFTYLCLLVIFSTSLLSYYLTYTDVRPQKCGLRQMKSLFLINIFYILISFCIFSPLTLKIYHHEKCKIIHNS